MFLKKLKDNRNREQLNNIDNLDNKIRNIMYINYNYMKQNYNITINDDIDFSYRTSYYGTYILTLNKFKIVYTKSVFINDEYIRIYLVDNKKELKVYENNKWIFKGEWCKRILNVIEEIEEEIYIYYDGIKKEEEQKTSLLIKHFNNMW